MKSQFTKENEKYNNETLVIISSTHSGDIHHILNNTVDHIESINIKLVPYPEKHGQLTQSGKNGNLQSSGMVYERDYEEEISEYIKTITQSIQDYIKTHDNSITRMIVAAPASIHSELSDALLDTLHNVHLFEISLIYGNYTKTPLQDALSILDGKEINANILMKNIN
jgi:ABC-type oligopeptide transport system substrate-binding subunit